MQHLKTIASPSFSWRLAVVVISVRLPRALLIVASTRVAYGWDRVCDYPPILDVSRTWFEFDVVFVVQSLGRVVF